MKETSSSAQPGDMGERGIWGWEGNIFCKQLHKKESWGQFPLGEKGPHIQGLDLTCQPHARPLASRLHLRLPGLEG